MISSGVFHHSGQESPSNECSHEKHFIISFLWFQTEFIVCVIAALMTYS